MGVREEWMWEEKREGRGKGVGEEGKGRDGFGRRNGVGEGAGG